jgi:hypothetical protein
MTNQSIILALRATALHRKGGAMNRWTGYIRSLLDYEYFYGIRAYLFLPEHSLEKSVPYAFGKKALQCNHDGGAAWNRIASAWVLTI